MTESLEFDFISVAGKQLTEHLTVVTGDALSILNVSFTFTRKNVQLCSSENSTFVYSQTIVPNITVLHSILLNLMMRKDGFNHWFVFILALQFIQKQLVIISNVTSNDHILPCSCVSFATCEQQKEKRLFSWLCDYYGYGSCFRMPSFVGEPRGFEVIEA